MCNGILSRTLHITLLKNTLLLKNPWAFSKCNLFAGGGSCPSNINDHWSQMTITNTSTVKYFENYQNGTQIHEVSTCCWEDGTYRLPHRSVVTNLQFVKKKKRQYMWSAIKLRAIQWGMPVEPQNLRVRPWGGNPRVTQTWGGDTECLTQGWLGLSLPVQSTFYYNFLLPKNQYSFPLYSIKFSAKLWQILFKHRS